MTRRRALLFFGAPSLLLLALAVWPLAAGTETLYLRDVADAHLPMKHVQAEALRDGRFPLVDPYRGGGQPLTGNPNALPFYPTNGLYLVASTLWAFNTHFWLHLFLALGATWWLARTWRLSRPAAWAAGAIYAASGWFLSHLAFYNLIAGAALAPALVAATLSAGSSRNPRGALLATGVLWALLLVSGDPSMAVLALALAVSAVVARDGLRPRRLGVLGLTLVAGTLVALPQIVEFLRILPVSFRGFYGVGAEARTAASFDPRQAVEWLLPYVFGRPDSIGYGRFWGHRFYTDWQPFFFSLAPGLLALALLPTAGRPRRRVALWAWGIVAAGMFFALGRFNPLAEALLALPGIDAFRFPVKLWLPVALGGSLIAGLGFELLLERQPRPRRRFLITLGALGGLLAIVWIFLFIAPDTVEALQRRILPAIYPADFLAFERGRWAETARISLLVAAALGLSSLLVRRRPAVAGAALLVIHVASQLIFQAPNLSMDAAAIYRQPPPLLEWIPPSAEVVHGGEGGLFGRQNLVAGDYPNDHVRWLDRRTYLELYPGAGVLWGRRYEIHVSPEGLDTFLNAAAAQLIRQAPDDGLRLRLLELWGVDRLILPRELDAAGSRRARRLHSEKVFGEPVTVWELSEAEPDVAFYGRLVRAPHVNRAVEILTDADFEPGTVAIVPGGGPAQEGEGGTARLVEVGWESWEIEVEARSPGVLVLQRTHLPIYRATVDGEPVATVPVNLHRIGVELPAGRHRVKIEAHRGPLHRSLWGAAIGLLGLLAVAFWPMQKGEPPAAEVISSEPVP